MPDADRRLMTIFSAVLERGSEAERSAYLAEACGDDAELRQRVEALLRAHQQAGEFLEHRRTAEFESGGGTSPQPQLVPGAVVASRFKLIEEIGEGGMGTVWMAQQTDPVKRPVALKLIKPGMDTKQVLARFEAERQALALMDHPNIAKVLDGGATPEGRPYFVMELVKGVPITKYCDEHKLTPRQRLELFVPVCQAVQHAHQKGIIHRDIKPSNILIALYDGRAVPKVIDFGVAKAAGQQLTDKTLMTGFGSVVGTLEYMSPEQAEMNQLDIDTRSDIYSLGVVLYELLTGSTPLDRKRLKQAAFAEVLRIIREEEPQKPSTRLSHSTDSLPSVSAQRQTEPAKLTKLVRGELDWIVMKALEKDRSRRYETANSFAMDIQRYLADEPVQACPPSAGYRLWKFARKFRVVLRVAAAFVALLIVAATVSTWQAVRATLAERQAVANFRMARDAVDRFFTEVSQSPDLKARGVEKFRRGLLLNAKEFYERFVREQPDTPTARYDLGLAHKRLAEIERELGDYAAAEASAGKAIVLLDVLASSHPNVAEYRRDLAASYVALGLICSDTTRWEKAEAAYQQALAIQEQQSDTNMGSAEHRYALAKTYTASGITQGRADNQEKAAKRYRQALDILSQQVPDGPLMFQHQSLLALTQFSLAQVCLTKGWYSEAETALKESTRIYETLVHDRQYALPNELQSLARSRALLGVAYSYQGQHEQAEKAQQQALEVFQKLAKEHEQVPEFAYDVGKCYFELARSAEHSGRAGEALAKCDQAIEVLERVVAQGYLVGRIMLTEARIKRAAALARRGDHALATQEAEAISREGNLSSVQIYNIGCVHARASVTVERDPKLQPLDHARLKSQYSDRAMDFLRQAIAKGYRNPDAIGKDPDVDPLRAREDFRTLLAELKAQQQQSGFSHGHR
jgi:tetratricopeptide (TPR) repeat protein